MIRQDLIEALITMAAVDPQAVGRLSLDDLRTRYDRTLQRQAQA